MVPLYVFLALAGVGYYVTHNTQARSAPATTIHKGDMPSMNNVYESMNTASVAQKEASRADSLFQAASRPNETGVISRNYRMNDEEKTPAIITSRLSGVDIPLPEFRHNNMVPFFGSGVRQNVSSRLNDTLLETYTGSTGVRQAKREVQADAFGDRVANGGRVYGLNGAYETEQGRLLAGRARQNETPFEKVYVGPGLDKGYVAEPSDGFQPDDRAYVLPKTVDDLRVGTNPKLTYDARTVNGLEASLPGEVGSFAKNRVDTYYENSQDRYLVTTGAVLGDRQRDEPIVKYQNREDTNREQMGPAQASVSATRNREDVQVPMRQNLQDFGVRNAGSIISAVIAPLLDLAKPSRAELLIMNPRTFGSMQVGASVPQKQTVYDPNDIARTTIKETLLQETVLANAKPDARKPQTYQMDDAKMTGRATLDAVDTALNVGTSVSKSVVYDPNDISRTTMRETTEEYKRGVGNVDGTNKRGRGYVNENYDIKMTNRTFTSDTEHFGVAQSVNEAAMSYDDMYNANINQTKEMTLEGREPTQTSVKVANGGDAVHIDPRRLERDSMAARLVQNPDRAPSFITASADFIGEQQKDRPTYCEDDRLDISLLKPFLENPYTHPLNSAV